MTAVTPEAVTLAYQLILGREPASPEDAAKLAAEVGSIRQLRNRLMLHPDARRISEILSTMQVFYRGTEAREKEYAKAMDAFLDLGPERETAIRAVLSRRDDKYTEFHRLRFFDQLRALSAIRTGKFGHLPEINVLDVGVMAVSGMYGEAVEGVRLHTCDHPRRVESNNTFGSSDFYPVDLETEDLGTKFPGARGKFHVILFCEVLEHLKMNPKEILADFKRLLAPGGVIYLTTPNGMAYTTFLAYFENRSPVARYSRQNRSAHLENFLHVREYTMKELAAGIEDAGLKIKHRAIKEFFHPDTMWASAFVSGRSLLTMVLEAP